MIRDAQDVLDPDVEETGEALELGRIVVEIFNILVHVLECIDVFGAHVTVRVEVEYFGEVEADFGAPKLVHVFARFANIRTQRTK